MIHVMARITFRPEFAAQARDILGTLVVATRREPGCLAYELFQRPDAPHVFQTVEQWTNAVAADAHMATAHVGAAIAAAGPMFAAPPEILTFSKLM
ncbi:MAG: antibiotic biosynthesis monooxygenase [Burkholderiales bacterium]|nr:antibiotic biosynthesis monooxygenase [Burkholderiales bacterium]MDE2627891.1 antibiotic biosynthesis monooxygenase [Burkholderiales bacterium]